jgi:hypothetical protein
MPRTARMTDALRGRSKALVYAGAAAAVAGACTAGAMTMASGAQAAPAVHHAAVHATAASRKAAKGAPVALSAHRSAERDAAAPAKPYQIYDSVTPSQIPHGHEVATYADGGYAVSPSQVAGKHVLWIDTNGSDPKASALDVEPGDATPSGAAAWAKAKLSADPRGTAIIYTMRSDWAAAKAAVAALPGHMSRHVQWWIADPTGTPHVIPGASATQWYWGSNYDITSATPGFWTAR